MLMQDIVFVKRVNIVSRNRFDKDFIIGFILYERRHTNEYRFTPKKAVEKNSHFLGPYPKQEDFPKDELDNLILHTVHSSYPNSNVHNVIMSTSSDVEMIENWKNRPFEQLEINIAPDFSGQNMEMLSGRGFYKYRRMVNIYVEGSSEMIKEIVLFGQCDLSSHEQIYDLLDNIVFL